jgi:hypothetical protein
MCIYCNAYEEEHRDDESEKSAPKTTDTSDTSPDQHTVQQQSNGILSRIRSALVNQF